MCMRLTGNVTCFKECGASEVMDLEGLAQGFQCLLNLCYEGKTFPAFRGLLEGDRYRRKGQERGSGPLELRLLPRCVLIHGPWHIAALRKYMASDGSRDAGAEDRRGLCFRSPPGLDQAATGAWGLVLPRETCPCTRRLPAARLLCLGLLLV